MMTQRAADRDEQEVARFLERFASVMVEAGIPPMPARVFSALLVSDTGRLTAAELSMLLSASPAAISGAVRYLEQIRIIRREREPGTRRDVYHVDNDWYEMTFRRNQVIARWATATRDGIGVLGPQTAAGQRMADSLDFFEFILQEAAGLTQRWEAHKKAGGPAAAGQDDGGR